MAVQDLGDVYITILAGGSGTRLWPRSRQKHPKQLLDLLGPRSLLQQTVDRALALVPPERIYVLTGPAHAQPIAGQLPSIPEDNILIEPSPRGTAPCLGLASVRLRQATGSGQGIMISLHSDHSIAREGRFCAAIVSAAATARHGHIVTVGILPGYPETGFGYIERGERLGLELGQDVYRVARFTEKPGLSQAREFVASGRFYWNAGYFAWRLDRILDEFQRLLPRTFAQLTEVATALGSRDGRAAQAAWDEITPVSIDVGIMERASDVAVLPCDMGWSDVGSWAALHDILPHDEDENVALGDGRHVGLDTSNSLVYSGGKLVATLGLEGMIVVDTGDALLVVPKNRAQEVSALVRELRARGLEEYL